MDCSPLDSSVNGDSPGKNTGLGCHTLLQGIFPGIEPGSPALQADSLPTELPRKPFLPGNQDQILFFSLLPTPP